MTPTAPVRGGVLLDPAADGPARIILGGAFGREEDAASFAKLDRFVESGGRLVETAYSYARGRGKQVVGQWLRAHGAPLGVVTKVGHGLDGADIPLDRATVLAHVRESIEVLGGEPLEVLLYHCDDPERPVEELADTLREITAEGLARNVGVSNWPASRLEALAIEVAEDPPPLVASYHWSLAAPRPEVLAPMGLAADDAVLGVVRTRGLPLLSWSAQAQGFFARTSPVEGREDPFDTPENRARRDRCAVLAAELGEPPASIALAWTLNHAGVWPTIGPSTLAHLDGAISASRITLSASQLEWLTWGEEGVDTVVG
ncbi:aldo/keto reductase [Microbacterium sp. PRC9]|uniref:aldo/keto reductase n=1 Tax=Microbacterium sp. PRC9 TaxID=2962591 RepID=UPI0028818641|nr:aldo/keto reductase [Microbacterium sp. PRC9]MDT0144526.1 aldo/keto reductase [Microbacterium sp. PRC9]